MVRLILHKESLCYPAFKPWLEESITIDNLKEQLMWHGLGRNDFIYYRSKVKSSGMIGWNLSGKSKFS